MVLNSVFDFMESPLVVWAKSVLNLSETELNYENFPNGEYFYQILKQTDPRLQNSNLPNEGSCVPYDTTRSRLLNLDFILRNTRSFYQNILNHILLIKLPDIYQIAKHPDTEQTFNEMEKMLLLLLGIAINGEFKEKFIEQIQQQLETQTQINLIPYIQLVTEDINFSVSKSILLKIDSLPFNSPTNNNTVVKTTLTLEINPTISESNISLESNSSSTTSFTNNCQQLVNTTISSNTNQLILSYSNLEQLNYFINTKIMLNVQRIVDERDSYLESIIELQQDKDYLAFKLNNCLELNSACSSNNINHDSSSSCNNLILNSPTSLLNVNSVNSGMSLLVDSCNSNNSNSVNSLSEANLGNSSSLIELSDPQTLLVLIESIYKEIASANNTVIESSSSIKSCDSKGGLDSINEECENGEFLGGSHHGGGSSAALLVEKLNSLNLENTLINCNSTMLLSDLKNRKLLANSWNQKIAIELVECKVKLRQLINEIEEKCEQIESLRDEIDQIKKQVNKLRNENVELQQKAALANVYSDELESLREKSTKVDKYESELTKLKERIEQSDANNARLEELKDENSILIETRTFMEKQLNDYQVRLLGMQRVDVDLNKYKQDIEDLLAQRELDKKRMCELCEKNAKFELETKNLLNQNFNLDEEVNYYKQKFTFTSAELSKQQQQLSLEQKQTNSQRNELNESNKLRLYEADLNVKELHSQMLERDQELSRLKNVVRLKEINSDECLAKVKVLSDQLSIELDNKMKYEKTLDQHKVEIRDLQLKLDECVNETKKLDHSIRSAAEVNDSKESENRQNFKKLIDSHDQLNNSYKKLLNDHEQLQKIYIQLESDYDDLYKELNKRHTQINDLNEDCEELRDKYALSLEDIGRLEAQNETLSKAKKDLKEASSNTLCTQEHDLELLSQAHKKKQQEIENFYEIKFEKLNSEISDCKLKRQQMELKMLELSKSLESNSNENLTLKSETKQLQMEITMNKDKIQMQFMQLTQMTDKVKSLETTNEKLQDEKSQLYEQIRMLLQQNQDLLTQLMANKDMHNEETKSYLNQVNNLKRQKEILEQKVMEHYKNSPSQTLKQKSKKSFNSIISNSPNNNNNSISSIPNTNTNTNQGLIRQLVQKVRNKSSSSSSQSSSSSACSSSSSSSSSVTPNQISNNEINILCNKNNNYTTQPQLISYTSDLTDHDSDPNVNKTHTFCHKYSADDINHLNFKDKDLIKIASSSPQSIITPTKQQQVAYIINNSNKIDPKSLKLGGRSPFNSTLSSSSSPIPRNSPIPLKQNDFQHQRALFTTSSPKCNNPKNNQSPTASSSSSSSCLSSSSSSTSLAYTQAPPVKLETMLTIQHQSPVTIITKNSSPTVVQMPFRKTQKVAVRLAESLSKLRSDIISYNDISSANHLLQNHQDDDDDNEDEDDDSEDFDDSDEGIQAFSNLKQHEKALLKTASKAGTTTSGPSPQNSNLNGTGSANGGNPSGKEVWLEYGCI